MKFNTFTLILSFVLLTQFGCQEDTTRYGGLDPDWYNNPIWQQVRNGSNQSAHSPVEQEGVTQNYQGPKIKFLTPTSHDFGKIALDSSNNVCEFVFKNEGNTDLVITSLKTSCSCTLVLLEDDKKEYAPGESGKIYAGYRDTQPGPATKHIYLYTNDPENPKTTLVVNAELVSPVDYEPKKLNLSLIDESGECPDITISSKDGKPFSITGFASKGDCISVQYNPNEMATQFVLKPTVDIKKLRSLPEGDFRISLSHPDCKIISGTYYAPPRFSVSPQIITISQADPSKTIVKTIYVTSNYNEDFDVKTTFANHSVVNVLDTQKNRNVYQVTVGINPPVARNGEKMFSENINLSLPGIDSFSVQCTGYYPGAQIPITEEEGDGECKTCGPVRVDKPSMSMYPR